jgi:tyrosinase
VKRDLFLASTSAAALASFVPAVAVGAPSRIYERLEVNEFSKNAKLVDAFRAGVAAMQHITDPKNVESWDYWAFSHMRPDYTTPPDPMKPVWNQCRHGVPYFFAWHRGFVFFFESMVRKMSGVDDFALPYWDYYKHPDVPAIFAAKDVDGKPNPLWHARANKTVTALKYNAFDPAVTKFPRDWPAKPAATNYEPLAESNPHGRVHNAVGGDMADVSRAAGDPVFWVHHCNIDRLWSAWVKAGGGREMPPKTDAWWRQQWAYDLDKKWIARLADMDDTTRVFGYRYSDVSLPSQQPALPARPPLVATSRVPLTANALGETGGLTLGLGSKSVAVPIPPAQRPKLHAFALSPNAAAAPTVVLEGVQTTSLGKKGGYSYDVYVNLPQQSGREASPGEFYLGEIGSFEISVAQMAHPGAPVTLSFPLAVALRAQAHAAGRFDESSVTVSFVRVGQPEGVAADAQFVKIARLRIVNAAAR